MTTATQTDKRIRRYTPIKRTLDILLSGIGILVLSPILLILCIAIKLDSPGPILFRQKCGHPQDTFPDLQIPYHAHRYPEGYADTHAEQSGTIHYTYRQIFT